MRIQPVAAATERQRGRGNKREYLQLTSNDSQETKCKACRYKETDTKRQIQRDRYKDTYTKRQIQRDRYKEVDTKRQIQRDRNKKTDRKRQIEKDRYTE